MLVERGLPGFNTNIVAAVAGVNVATLYHHFADKHAVLRTMYERYLSTRTLYLSEQLQRLPSAPDLTAWVDSIVGGLLDRRTGAPEGRLIRRSVRLIPHLTEVDTDAMVRGERLIAAALVARRPTLPMDRAEAAGRILIEGTSVLLDIAEEDPARMELLRRELVVMIAGYLHRITDGEGPDA